MDPLSVAANIVAVVGAAKDAAKTLEKLASFRHAPQQFILVLNEISDFRTILAIIQDTISQLQDHGNKESAIDQHLGELLKRALTILEEANTIARLSIPNNHNAGSPKRISKRWLLRNRGVLEDLQNRIHNIRTDLSNALTILSASEIPRTRIRLNAISLSQRCSGIETEVETVSTTVLRPSLNAIQTLLQNIQSHQNTVPPALSNQGVQTGQTSQPQSMFSISNTVESEPSCSGLCLCRCHTKTNLSTPVWLQGFVGLLFLGYTGNPLLGHINCNEKRCRGIRSALITVNYFFPAWFVSRMITLRDKWTPTRGNLLTVRTPRVVHDTAPLFAAIYNNDVSHIRMLFSEGKASPFDVNDRGRSALRLAVSFKNLEIVRLLLNECADPYQGSGTILRSPVEHIWSERLSNPLSAKVASIYNLLAAYIDPEIETMNCGFTVLHQIVLKLRRLDLRSQLEISTAEIDIADATGWTPLFWAGVGSDFPAMNTLLDFRASLYVRDRMGRTIVHAIATTGNDDTEALDILSRAAKDRGDSSFENAIKSVDNVGNTAFENTCYSGRITQARWLIARGASVDEKFSLLTATQFNHHSILELLLESGAKTDVKDDERMGILHTGAIANLESINILSRWRWSLAGVALLDKDMYGHTPLETFEITRPNYVQEDVASNKACREAFQALISGIEELQAKPSGSIEHFHPDIRSERLSLGPLKPEDITTFEIESLNSDPEEWFETESFVEDEIQSAQ